MRLLFATKLLCAAAAVRIFSVCVVVIVWSIGLIAEICFLPCEPAHY
jgi:hypothetical protein